MPWKRITLRRPNRPPRCSRLPRCKRLHLPRCRHHRHRRSPFRLERSSPYGSTNRWTPSAIRSGTRFHGTLSAPIVIGGETVIPSGADVVGTGGRREERGAFRRQFGPDPGIDGGLHEWPHLQHPDQSVVARRQRRREEHRDQGRCWYGCRCCSWRYHRWRQRRCHRSGRRSRSRNWCRGLQEGPANPIGA